MKVIIPIFGVILAAIALRSMGMRRKSESRYDRHNGSDWNRLSQGEDPSL